ncbi:MAG: CvpA family protein [Clostridia bacterium]|nr:CvpA family protein [Clostridia bacterium]
MSFTLFSVILLLAVALAVFIEVRRGLRRGFVRTAVGLSAVLVSALGAVALALWVSDLLADLGMEIIELETDFLDGIRKLFPRVTDIAIAAVDALLAPILFAVFFPLLRLIVRIVVSILFRAWRYDPDDPRHMATPKRPNALVTPTYEPASAPWHRRHDRLLGGILGGVSGFLAALCILSPVLGTLSTARTLLHGLERMNAPLTKVLPAEVVASAEPYVNDGGAAILSAAGGDLIFDAAANTKLNGRTVSLRREVEACMEVCYDFSRVIRVVTKLDQATAEQRRIIGDLGERIDESEFTRLLAADFLNSAANAWLEGEKFMNIQCPNLGEILTPLMDKALLVCAEATPDCVGRDITTVLRIYLIAVESGLTENPDREDLMATLDEGGVLDRIYAELKKNPCMAHLAAELSNTALRIMAEAIDWADFSSDVYRDLMGNLSEAMNLVNGMEGATFSEQVDTMTRYTMHYAQQYGVELPESMAKMAATAMVEQLAGDGRLTADHLEEFFNHYMNRD